MSQTQWQQQLNQFMASLPQLLGLALSLGAMRGMMGAVTGAPAAPPLLPHTHSRETKPPAKRKPTRDQVEVEVWFERDRAFVGLKDRATEEYVAEWWDDRVVQLIEDGFFKAPGPLFWRIPKARRDFDNSVLDYAEETGILRKG